MGLVVLVLGFVAFVQLTWDKRYEAPYPQIIASSDSAVIARGAYLANSAAHCGARHTSMNEVELIALYKFFQSLEPVENSIGQIVFVPGEKPE